MATVIAVIHLLANVFRQVRSELGGALAGSTFPRPRANVDIAVAYNLPPQRSKQFHILPAVHCKVPMPCTPLLSFKYRHILKVIRQGASEKAQEPRQIGVALASIRTVLTVRECQHVIQQAGLDQSAYCCPSPSTGPHVIFN
jgi:hypothetical protein